MTLRLPIARIALACGALAAAVAWPHGAHADSTVGSRLQAVCLPLTAFCGDFLAGFGGWDGLNGNTGTPDATGRYFRVLTTRNRLPVGTRYFRALVDEHARDGDEPGQRTLVYLFPNSSPVGGKTGAFEGSEQWYHSALSFPRQFRPSPGSEWNWVLQWHNWPDRSCCINIAVTVDTSNRHRGGRRGTSGPFREELSMRVMGGGDSEHPLERYRSASRNPRVRTHWFVGDPHLKRGHWYDLLVRVRWSYRRSLGLVEWWLDGRRVMSVRTPTLFWYEDNDSDAEGETAGPGQAYWMVGYYRSGRRRSGSTDRSVAWVNHNGARRGPTRTSVGF
jgi:Polysaccharide lyase